MGINEKQSVVVDGVRRCDGHTVGTGWFRRVAVVNVGYFGKRFGATADLQHGRFAVERLKLADIHALDVAADAAFAERERHPGLEMFDDSRLHFRMFEEVVVQSVGEGVHERF